MIEQTVVQVNGLWEGSEANNEDTYWFIALLSWQEFPETHGKVMLR